MKKEHELILKVVIKKKSKEDIAQINELLNESLDWCEIAGQVVNHRLGGYFYNGLTAEQRKAMPKEFEKLMQIVIKAQEAQLKERVEEFSRVANLLEENKVRYCGLKGIAFCADFYSLKDRRSNDVDILVHEDDLNKLDALLRSLGYLQSNLKNGVIEEATKKEKLIQRMNYHDLVPYVKELSNGIMEIDINFQFDSKDHEIDDEIFEYGTKMYSHNGVSVRGLPVYTHLLFLCIHFHREATNSLWVNNRSDVLLYKIVDIVNCIKAHEDEFDVKEWCELVEKFELEQKCYYTFATLSSFYSDKIIEDVVRKLKPKDISFMDEIFVEGENRTELRDVDFYNVAFNWVN